MNDRGYFIIAQNNKEHDYIRMAYALALSIKFTQTDIVEPEAARKKT